MNILVQISTRTELIASAIVALVCHAALFSLFAGEGAPPAEASAATDLQITMVPPEELVTREPVKEPVREKQEVPVRERSTAPVREPVSSAVRSAVPERSRAEREPLGEREERIHPETRRIVETPKQKIERPRREKIARKPEEPAVGSDRSRSAEILNKREIGRMLNDEYSRLAAFRKGFQGKVVLKLLVSSDGRVEQVSPTPVRSSGFATLDSGAVRIVERLRTDFLCKPALDKKGRPVARWIEQTFTFNIEGDG